MFKAKERSVLEKRDNQAIIKESEGRQVLYETEVQLMHADSEGFLVGKNECSKTEQIGNSLEISYEYSNRMYFRFVPKYKTRSKGDLIQYTDIIYIMNATKGNSVSVSHSNYIRSEKYISNETNPFK